MKLIKKIMEYLYPYKKMFVFGQLAMILSLAAGVTLPLVIKNLLDLRGAILVNIAILTGISLLSSGSNYIKGICLGKVSNNIIVDIRNSLFNHLQEKSIDFYNKKNSGEIVSRMTYDINLFQEALSTGITYIIQMVMSLLAIVTIMFYMDWMLSFVMIVIFPMIMLITRKLSKPVEKVSTEALANLSKVTSSLNQSISGISIIKSFMLESFAKNRFKNENSMWLKNKLKQVKIKARTNMVTSFLDISQIIIMLGVGVWRIQTGHMTIGALTAFIMYAQSLSSPLSMISRLYVDVKIAMAAVRRIFEIIYEDNIIIDDENPIIVNTIKGEVIFNKVDFSYNDGKQILNNLDLHIPQGKTVALVGASGAGKTTIMNLIPRFYDVNMGQITIDGIDIKKIAKKSLRSHIAIVPQSSYLFDMSISDNIACGNPKATHDEIVLAAKRANAHDFIMKMENTYDSMAGEGGVMLSGGQKQRISIARAFLKNSEILLLDEATSALDNVSERLVQNAISKLMKRRTTIIVAHRLSTIVEADIIFVVDDGEIIESGTHEELIENSNHYKAIYNASVITEEKLRNEAI